MAHYLKKRRRGGMSLGIPKDICLLMWVAEQKGLFSDEGLNLNVETVPYSRKAMDMLIAGETDSAILVETNVAYLGYIAPKIPIKCLASVETRTADSVLMRAAPDETLTPADLKGKRVGFMPRTTSHSFLFRFLEEHNIDKRDIDLKVITPQAMGSGLIRGEVDAISNWQPYTHNTMHAMDELGLGYAHFPNTGFYASEVVFAVSKPFLVKNRGSVEAFLQALRAAESYMKNHPEEAAPILAQKLKASGSAHQDIWTHFQPRLQPISDKYMENIELLGRWIHEKDTEFQRRALPDYTDYVDNTVFLDIFGEYGV